MRSQVLSPDGRPLSARSGDWTVTFVDPACTIDWSTPSVFELVVVNATGHPAEIVPPRTSRDGNGSAVRLCSRPQALHSGSTAVVRVMVGLSMTVTPCTSWYGCLALLLVRCTPGGGVPWLLPIRQRHWCLGDPEHGGGGL